MLILSPFIQRSTGNLSEGNLSQEKEIKVIQTGKEEVKLPLFVHVMTLYTENPKDSTKKLLEIINEFSKLARYKISIQISVVFLYTNNELSEREIRKINL